MQTPQDNLLRMKPSSYLYVLPLTEGKSIIFNGLTWKFLIVPDEQLSNVSYAICHSHVISHNNPFYHKIVNAGFILETDVDEIELIKNKRDQYVNQKEYQTIILPTFNCNYSCWYCVQGHQETSIDKPNIELIKKHITTYLSQNSITSYHLTWFGGEPLLEPEAIKEISSYALHYCDAIGIDFVGSMTTNGGLLTNKIIRMLTCCQINNFQITIDGCKINHDTIRNDNSGVSSFETILTNVRELLEYNIKANVILRYNYTPETLKDTSIVEDVNQYIPQKLRNRISIDLKKVWQIAEKDVDISNVARILRLFSENGYRLLLYGILGLCYVEKRHFHSIFYNGTVDKCNNRPLNSLRGHLSENGDIEWKQQVLYIDYDIFAENSKCLRCNFLPLCQGGCPKARDTQLQLGKQIICPKDKEQYFQHRILDFCWRQILNQKLKY